MIENMTMSFCRHNIIEHIESENKETPIGAAYTVTAMFGIVFVCSLTHFVTNSVLHNKFWALLVTIVVFFGIIGAIIFGNSRSSKAKAKRKEMYEKHLHDIDTNLLGYKMAGVTQYKNCYIVTCVKEEKYGVLLFKMSIRDEDGSVFDDVYCHPSEVLEFVYKYGYTNYPLHNLDMHIDMVNYIYEAHEIRQLRYAYRYGKLYLRST